MNTIIIQKVEQNFMYTEKNCEIKQEHTLLNSSRLQEEKN